MRSLRLSLLFPVLAFLLIGVFCTSCVYAKSTDAAQPLDEDDDVVPTLDDDAAAYDKEELPMSFARVVFTGNPTAPTLTMPAGTTTEAVIAFQSGKPAHTLTVILITGFITPVNKFDQVIQNFSVVRHARTVRHDETTSFQYSFTPDALLEPADYNLVIGVYFHDNNSNNTFFAAAYNRTITIDEALGTDPKTILTYLTLLAIFAAVVYVVADKTGILGMLKGRGAGPSRRRVEVGTNGEGYDPDYISKEHHKYKEDVLQKRASPSPNKKKASPSPNKKKN